MRPGPRSASLFQGRYRVLEFVDDLAGRDNLPVAVRVEVVTTMRISREFQPVAAGFQQLRCEVCLVWFDKALTDFAALCQFERVSHGSADQDLVANGEQVLNHVDFVRHLGSANDRDERSFGFADRAREVADFPFDKESNDAWFSFHELWNQVHRRVRAVARAECVVDVDFAKAGECGGERVLHIVRRLAIFARIKPHIFQHQYLAVL